MSDTRQSQAVLHGAPRVGKTPRGALFLLCVALLGFSSGCDSRSELTRVDSEKEANLILVELAERGVPDAGTEEKSVQRKTSFAITVPKDKLAKARAILVQCDLPRDNHGGFGALVEGGGLIPTKSEERAKFMYAMAGELERTLETIDRVVSARVHIVLPERDVMQRDTKNRPNASAMVLIKYTPVMAAESKPAKKSPLGLYEDTPATNPNGLPAEFADAPVQPEQIQQMVAKSVEGLTPSDVFVTYTRSVGRQVAETKTAVAAAPVSSSGGSTSSAVTSGADHQLLVQLFAATAVFGLAAVVMTALLVREKRRNRTTALALAER
jgi:type III secretion system YscJ/HrcJ family lipoprotein